MRDGQRTDCGEQDVLVSTYVKMPLGGFSAENSQAHSIIGCRHLAVAIASEQTSQIDTLFWKRNSGQYVKPLCGF